MNILLHKKYLSFAPAKIRSKLKTLSQSEIRRMFFEGAIFLRSPPHHDRIFLTPLPPTPSLAEESKI